MDINTLKSILDTMSSLRIEKAIIEPYSEGKNTFYIRGADKNTTLAILSKMSTVDLVEKKLGIHNVSTLLNRLNLLDLDKTKVDVNSGHSYIKSINMAQGRTKVSYTFSDPNMITDIPIAVKEPDPIIELKIDEELFKSIGDAVSAMKPEMVRLETKDGSLVLKLHDGVSDLYETVVSEAPDTRWGFNWTASSFMLSIKQQLKKNNTALLYLDKSGLIHTSVEGLDVLLLPQLAE